MSFFSKLFGKTQDVREEEPHTQTREDMENTLSVRYQETRQHGRLNRAFTRQRPPKEEEKKLLTEVLDIIASVPEGKKVLDNAIQNGYSFSFEAFRENSDGCMSGEKKKITLCPPNHSSAAALAVTAFHELVHAVQNERTDVFSNSARLTIADQLKFQRATEAAACAEESRFAFRIKDRYPEVERHVSQFPMYTAYATEMEKSGDPEKAGEASFKAWYGYKHFQQFYEEEHCDNIAFYLNTEQKKKNKKALTDTMDSAEVLKTVFISEDLPKRIDPAFLTSKDAFSISMPALFNLKRMVSNYAERLGIKQPDRSVETMYSFDTGRPYAANDNSATEQKASSARPQKSMMSALRKIDRDVKTKQTAGLKIRADAARR